MKCLVGVDSDQNTSPMVVENISETVNASIKKWFQKEKNKLVKPGKRVIIAFYEQVDELPLSPLQQRLLDLRTSLQQLKIKLASLKEKLEELKRGLSVWSWFVFYNFSKRTTFKDFYELDVLSE